MRAFVCEGASARRVLPSEVEIFEGDFAQRASAVRAMQGVELVFLLAAVHERMSEFELGFIDAAREARVARVVKFSAVGSHPASAAGATRERAGRRIPGLHGATGWDAALAGSGGARARDPMPDGRFLRTDRVVERIGGRRPGTIDDFIRRHAAPFGG